ncbi:MFS transporter [Deinococcus metalli]|uniref:MFS transporter n=1 Tax=Deinococcus metalli TaxID=1141878 RepID=UPI0021A27E62|nr:MFS transporter [Deinococcus metalli]
MYTYAVALLGPAVPFLRAELHLDYALAGLHATMFAAGAVAVGAAGERLTARVGRAGSVRLGALGTGLALALLAAAHSPVLSLLAAAVLGVGATVLVTTAQTLLADRDAAHQRTALVEAGIVSSVSGSAAGWLIGTLQQAGAGWRAALLLPVLAAVALSVWRPGTRPEVAAAPASGRPSQPLPRAFWRSWGLVFAIVTVEWGLSFWGAAYLTTRGLAPEAAARTFSAYLLALLAGRLLGGVVIRRVRASTPQVIGAALAVTAAGFTVFWLAPVSGWRAAGLIVTGLGVANLYPLGLSLALAAAPDAQDLASTRITLAVGVAILLAPLALGALADRLDLQVAYGLVPAALLGAALLLDRRPPPG